MKVLFFVLLAANIVALALFQFTGGRSGEPMKGHEPFQAEKIKLLSQSELQARKTPVQQPEKTATPSSDTIVSMQCMEWGAVAVADTERAKSALQKLNIWDKAQMRKMEKTSGFWVYVPPRKTLADAQRKVIELKALGVQEIFVLQDHTPWKYAISLGVFSTGDAAEKYLAKLREKGVRSAITGSRNREVEALVFTINNLDPALAAEVGKLKASFAGSDIKTIDCR